MFLNKSRWIACLFTVFISFGVFISARVRSQPSGTRQKNLEQPSTPLFKPNPKIKPIFSFSYSIPDFSTKEAAAQADRKTGYAIQEWRGASSLVHRLIENPQTSMGPKANAIEFLGGIRSVSSVQPLILQINFKDTRPFRRGGSAPARAFQPYPARYALREIGLPAKKWILRILSNNHNWEDGNFAPAQVKGFAEVLAEIEGKKFALLKLQEQQERIQDSKAKEQFQLVINEVQKYPKEHPKL